MGISVAAYTYAEEEFPHFVLPVSSIHINKAVSVLVSSSVPVSKLYLESYHQTEVVGTRKAIMIHSN